MIDGATINGSSRECEAFPLRLPVESVNDSLNLQQTMRTRFFTGTLAVLVLGLAAASADDWPQWRGPNRDGLSKETGLLKEWPPGGPKLLWKSTGMGAGYSSVSVSKGKIFTAGEADDSSFVLALDANGKKIWSARLGRPGDPDRRGAGPRCSPSVSDDNIVVALGQYGDLVAVDAADGKERWRKNVTRDFGGSMMSGWGYSESPLIDGDRVLCTPGGSKATIVAVNKNNGEVIWQTTGLSDRAGYSSIVAARLGGVPQYVQITDSHVVGLAVDSGKILWRADRPGQTAVIPTPVVRDDLVYVTSGYGVGCNLFKVTAKDGAFNVQEVYANKTMVNHHGGVVLVGDHIYGYSDRGGWMCQDFKTGEVAWSERGKLGKGSIVFADGRLFLRSEGGKGTVAMIEASPSGFHELGRFDQPDRSDKNSWPHPVVANGKLFLRDQDVLLCYELKP